MERVVIELDTVLIKVASRCNINCSYCYVYNMGDSGWMDMPSQISDDTTQAVARALAELTRIQDRRFAVVLHGANSGYASYKQCRGIRAD